jgi:hypothetical protein
MPNYPLGIIHQACGAPACRDDFDGVPVRRMWLYPRPAGRRGRLLVRVASTTGTIALALMRRPTSFCGGVPVTLALAHGSSRNSVASRKLCNTDLEVEHAGGDGWMAFVGSFAQRVAGSKLMHDALCVTTVTHAFIDHFHRVYGVPRERLAFCRMEPTLKP